MSVIRRKHTANFTTIGNALFNDDRLAADELGVLAYLLSRPNDWEVRRPALARRFDVGKQTIKRIILNLIQYGWIQAKKTRLPNGTYHTIYEVRDEPGRTLTADEAKAATSSVSDDADEPAAAAVQAPDGDPPDITERGLGDQGSQTGSGHIKELNTDSEITESPNGARAFADVKVLWPADNVLSDVAAASAYAGLPETEQKACFEGIKPYLAECRDVNRKVCDLTTYIREKRWKRFTDKARAGTPTIVKPGTPNWHRWKEHFEEIGDPRARVMETFKAMGRDFWAPDVWPPAKGQSPPKSQSAA